MKLKLPIANASDSYKLTHHRIYPDNLEYLLSYFEPRGESAFSDEVVFFGLQYMLKSYLEGQVITERDIPRLKAFCKHHFYGDESLFNEDGWDYIVKEHDGRLPVVIRAVPEGTVVPVSNVLMTIENTDPKCAWLVNFLETLLVEVWYPMTVASLSRSIKKTIYDMLEETADEGMADALISTRLHDFGYRGVSSPESAAWGGAGHLVNFTGTDTVAALELITQFYSKGTEYYTNDMYDKEKIWSEVTSYNIWDDFYRRNMAGNSIPATEHSIMTMRGPEGEAGMCERLLNEFPNGFVACVSDSYDIYNCCREIWGTQLKDKIIERNGVLVVRPDSGHPPKIVCEVLQILGEKFGYWKNSKGYHVLTDCVRVIQGDGIDYRMVSHILKEMKKAGWSAENIAFGSGGALLQKLDRDTFACAFKACQARVDGEEVEVYKKKKE